MLRQDRLIPRERPEIPAELRRRRRRSATVKCGEWRWRRKPCLQSFITENVRSLLNKMKELAGLTRLQREYREYRLMHFAETWLNDIIPDWLVQLNRFHLVRAERNTRESCKKKGRGNCTVCESQVLQSWTHSRKGATMYLGHWAAGHEHPALLSTKGVFTRHRNNNVHPMQPVVVHLQTEHP